MTKRIKIAMKSKPNLISLFDKYIRRIIASPPRQKNHYYAQGSIAAYLAEKLDELYGVDNWDENDAYEYARLLGINEAELVNSIQLSNYPTDEDDDWGDDDYYHNYWDNSFGIKKKHKHKKAKKEKKSKIVNDYYDDYSFDDIAYADNDDYEYYPQGSEFKEIWYYPDYHDDTDKLEFNSLKEFSDYCTEEGIYVPPYMGELLKYQSVSHCCLNGTSKEHGQLELTVDDSYGNMFYTACTMSEAREIAK